MGSDSKFKQHKDYLMQYRKIHTKIDRLRNKLNRLNERYDLKGVSYSSQPSGSVKQTLDDVLAQKEYIEDRLGTLEDESFRIRNEIQDKLLDLDNQLEAEVLDLYFLERYSLIEIAEPLLLLPYQIKKTRVFSSLITY